MTRKELEKLSKPELIKILSGASDLDIQLEITRGVIADDLRLINKGELDKTKILNLDDKYFKRISDMLKTKSDLFSPPLLNKTGKQPSETKVTEPDENSFEAVSKRVQEKINGK